ncbi:DUF397 domain-containing protein [Streptomyces chattanoogensis]
MPSRISRYSKDLAGPHLTIGRDEWERFVSYVAHG